MRQIYQWGGWSPSINNPLTSAVIHQAMDLRRSQAAQSMDSQAPQQLGQEDNWMTLSHPAQKASPHSKRGAGIICRWGEHGAQPAHSTRLSQQLLNQQQRSHEQLYLQSFAAQRFLGSSPSAATSSQLLFQPHDNKLQTCLGSGTGFC